MPPADRDESAGAPVDDRPADPGAEPVGYPDGFADDAPTPFVHPPWTVGLVLVAGAITLLFGVLVSPIWLLVGSPFVAALGLWLYVVLAGGTGGGLRGGGGQPPSAR